MIHDAVYVCKDCGHVFDHPKVTHDGGYWEEPWNVCPKCLSENYVLAERCSICKELFPKDELAWGICKNCLDKELKEHATDFIKQDISLFDDFAWWMHKREEDGDTHCAGT